MHRISFYRVLIFQEEILRCGEENSFARVAKMAEYARNEINSIGGYYAYGRDLVNGTSIYDYDVTKLSVYTLDIGLAGIEVYDLLRDEYDIQIEFGDICNILAYISIGDRIQMLRRLCRALQDIKRLYSRDRTGLLSGEYINPEVAVSPQKAFYAEKKSLSIKDSVGCISGEFVMCYPPGDSDSCPGGTDYKRDCGIYSVCKRKRMLYAGNRRSGSGISSGTGMSGNRR